MKNEKKGTRLLRSFRIALQELRTKDEERLLLDVLIHIKRHVATMPGEEFQMPMVTHNLTKHLFITMPKLENREPPIKKIKK